MNNEHNRLTDSLTKTNTDCLKGILAICVLLCHLWGSLAQSNATLVDGIAGRMLGVLLMSFGYLSVSMFFFLSGYGLMVQYTKRGNDYMKSFLRRRVLPLYLLCAVLIVFYLGVRTAFGEGISLREIMQSFLFGRTVISYGWYLQSILIWYLLFYACFRFFRKEKNQLLALMGAFVLYVALCILLKLEHTWYESAFCLPIGVFWARDREKIEAYLGHNKKYVCITLIAVLAFVCSFILVNLAPVSPALALLLKCISSNLFVVTVVLLLKLIPIHNLITKFLGEIYLEIYVIHGCVLMLYRSKFIYIANGILYSLAVFATTILFAWAIAPSFKKILQIGKGKRQ